MDLLGWEETVWGGESGYMGGSSQHWNLKVAGCQGNTSLLYLRTDLSLLYVLSQVDVGDIWAIEEILAKLRVCLVFLKHLAKVRLAIFRVIAHHIGSRVAVEVFGNHCSRPDTIANPPCNVYPCAEMKIQAVGVDERKGVRIIDDGETERAEESLIKLGVHSVLNHAREEVSIFYPSVRYELPCFKQIVDIPPSTSLIFMTKANCMPVLVWMNVCGLPG